MTEETTPSQATESAAPNTGGTNGDAGARKFRDKDGLAGEGRGFRRKRRKVSYLTINKINFVDYKEVNILRRFINERGKILPCKQSGNTAKQQRMIASSIRRAREMALLPFVATEVVSDRPRPRVPREGRPERFNREPRREESSENS